MRREALLDGPAHHILQPTCLVSGRQNQSRRFRDGLVVAVVAVVLSVRETREHVCPGHIIQVHHTEEVIGDHGPYPSPHQIRHEQHQLGPNIGRRRPQHQSRTQHHQTLPGRPRIPLLVEIPAPPLRAHLHERVRILRGGRVNLVPVLLGVHVLLPALPAVPLHRRHTRGKHDRIQTHLLHGTHPVLNPPDRRVDQDLLGAYRTPAADRRRGCHVDHGRAVPTRLIKCAGSSHIGRVQMQAPP